MNAPGNAKGSGGLTADSGGGDSLQPILIKVAGAVAAGVGIVGFVAVVGGAYFWMRFSSAGLPADEAVADMSHTQLIVVGARLIIPFVGIALVEVVLFYFIDQIVTGDQPMGFRLRLAGTLLVVAIALAVDLGTARRLTWLSVLVAVAVALILVGATALYARNPKTDYPRFVLAFIGASAAFGVFWAASQVSEAPDVRPAVMVVNGKPLAGLYVTSSSDLVYIAEVCTAGPHSDVGRSTTGSLVDVPRADVSLLLVGDNSGLESAIGRERTLLESLPRLSKKVTQPQINAVAPPPPRQTGGAPCTGPSAARLAR